MPTRSSSLLRAPGRCRFHPISVRQRRHECDTKLRVGDSLGTPAEQNAFFTGCRSKISSVRDDVYYSRFVLEYSCCPSPIFNSSVQHARLRSINVMLEMSFTVVFIVSPSVQSIHNAVRAKSQSSPLIALIAVHRCNLTLVINLSECHIDRFSSF